MKAFIAVLLGLTLWGALAGGCSSSDISNPNQIVFPASQVSFSKQVYPYMTLSCNVTGCHDGSGSAGAPDFTSWVSIRNATGVAVPKDTNSYLVLVMYGKVQHPLIVANDNQRLGIKTWIREGALDN